MKRLLLALGLLCAGTVLAYAADSASVVSSCGSASYTAGTVASITQDTTGKGCSAVSVTFTPSGTQDINVKQVNGHTVVEAASGVMQVGIVGNAGAAIDAATGAAPPANVIYMGANGSGATGGHMAGIKTCDSSATYDASTNGKTTIVAGVSGRKTYICGYIIGTGSSATNVSIGSGTGANCGSTYTAITPAFQLPANGLAGMNSSYWNGLATLTAADNLCVSTSAGNAVQVQVNYTIQ